MSKNKILIKITGSIAAYKSAYLASKLVQKGYEVKIAATVSALKFIGATTFEGLTGNKVFTDTFEEDSMMSHIDLAKWADIVVVVPASANTINKFAAGIADNLVTTLFLAHDWSKPYIIAPAMNVNMLKHPATQNSLRKLSDMGAIVLPTDEGHLACGDMGAGKLLDPDIIFGKILHYLNRAENGKRYLITGGGTSESIDEVRFVSNMSTGNTAKTIADKLFLLGNEVTLLKAESAAEPDFVKNIQTFQSFRDLKTLLNSELKNNYNAVIHLAAVSDYSPVSLSTGNEKFNIPLNRKLKSDVEELTITFTKNEKLVDTIKNISNNRNIKLISFKLSNFQNDTDSDKEAGYLFSHSSSDFVVYNNLKDRRNNKQSNFKLFIRSGDNFTVETPGALAELINRLITKEATE